MRTFLRAHLRPLVHCLLARDLAFMPHGENLITVLRDGVPLPILTDVFDGFLRHLAAILDEDGLLAEDSCWAAVRACIEEHEADHPVLAEAAKRYDLLRPEFQHSCLNRLQLRNTLEMVDLAGPVESMLHAGTLMNPAARRS